MTLHDSIDILKGMARDRLKVQASLRPGESLVCDATVKCLSNNCVVVHVNEHVSFSIMRGAYGRASVCCYTDGQVLPRHVPAGETAEAAEPTEEPLCKFGPGGDFAREYTPDNDPLDAHEHAVEPNAQCPVPSAQ